jgi:hypothetical protein
VQASHETVPTARASHETLPAAREIPRTAARSERRRGSRSLLGGGTDGNEQLTTITGVVLILLLAVIGLTILRIHQLISVHLFVGLLLIGPVALKLVSTGYRFMRYYSGNLVYRKKGPPETWLRLLAPLVVLTTVIVFVTGVLLMFAGPAHRNPLLAMHKVGFIIWIAVTGLHVLGHLPAVGRLFGIDVDVNTGVRRGARSELTGTAGAAGRWIALAGAIVAGLVLAIVLIPHFHLWSGNSAFLNHHHDG